VEETVHPVDKPGMKKIIAICYVDVGSSWGPAVHFLEVWNRIDKGGKYEVEAYACCDMKKPYIDSPCIRHLFRTGNTPVGRVLVKIVLDVFLFFRLLAAPRTIVYIRWAQYCILAALACRLKGHITLFEMNGLGREDCISADYSLLRRWQFYVSEAICLRDKAAHIVAVSNAIERSVKKAHGSLHTVTIPNGCKPSLNEINRRERPQRANFTVAYVGTFTPWDGHMLLPVVARIYLELNVPVKMQLAGLRLERSSIYKDVTGMPCFDYRGNVEYAALDAFYRTADAGIALYEFERHRTVELSSLKLFEYFACRLPILTTAVPGTEFVEDLRIGMRLREEEMGDPEKLKKRLNEFYTGFSRYVEAYSACPPARTWQNVADETAAYLDGNCT
jgi:glycosyltransferase involved in cell wall biosynthesis